uniref:Spectrin alpha chain, non-erythrocytic 1 (Fragments) n=1 Tax=Capra hircus TaxID=9925 RepID=SPTN1_CAPHI|nr:RecName: Full=Spectrin alpha chain, non-erythrocytic 1; AltName: Full=Alpha-II spectrin; AltName: Full=Fodrin alpha chain [Capra hircus]
AQLADSFHLQQFFRSQLLGSAHEVQRLAQFVEHWKKVEDLFLTFAK